MQFEYTFPFNAYRLGPFVKPTISGRFGLRSQFIQPSAYDADHSNICGTHRSQSYFNGIPELYHALCCNTGMYFQDNKRD